MKKFFLKLATTCLIWFCTVTTSHSQSSDTITFIVTPHQETQTFHVEMKVPFAQKDTIVVKLPAWTPGYYQLLNFADHVSDFTAHTPKGETLFFKRFQKNGWKVAVSDKTDVIIRYTVRATRQFVATPYIDFKKGYISPPGVFMHIEGEINHPASVIINLPSTWTAATGLEPVAKKPSSFIATDFDVLYDSPILMGTLEELPAFTIQGIPHRFIGYNLGEFDRIGFMNDLKKIVTEAIGVIGHIPYKHYTFLAIGQGPGGIEHLNSTTFGFSGESLKTREGKNKMYTFLAHEYFHHYNVKRIRPIELGPFNYDQENRTNMLWVSEGITVYYDLLITRRAGLLTTEELLESFRARLLGYENKPGRLYQSATQASYNTWSDGPFGRSGDEINKTVSVYDKGAILGLLLDFNIRNATKNTKTLDHVMQTLYTEFYLEKKRGFTEHEFQEVCERIAGTKLSEVFSYAATTKPIDYKKYFAYAGLEIDSDARALQGGWLGITSKINNDSIYVTQVDFESPAWNAGIRRHMIVLKSEVTPEPILKNMQSGDVVTIKILNKGKIENFNLRLATKLEGSYKISPAKKQTKLQQTILNSWLGTD